MLNQSQEANARLIAAAPELLDAAEGCLQIFDDLYHSSADPGEIKIFGLLRKAIAKAKGE